MQIIAFWDTAPSSPGRKVLKMAAVSTAKTSVYVDETTWRNIPEGSHHIWRRESFVSQNGHKLLREFKLFLIYSKRSFIENCRHSRRTRTPNLHTQFLFREQAAQLFAKSAQVTCWNQSHVFFPNTVSASLLRSCVRLTRKQKLRSEK
jgi:hypothetical protein